MHDSAHRDGKLLLMHRGKFELYTSIAFAFALGGNWRSRTRLQGDSRRGIKKAGKLATWSAEKGFSNQFWAADRAMLVISCLIDASNLFRAESNGNQMRGLISERLSVANGSHTRPRFLVSSIPTGWPLLQ